MTGGGRLTVGIGTLDRPEGLASLLNSLRVARKLAPPDLVLSVLVCDNSAGGSAAGICEQVSADSPELRLSYLREEERGYASARNALLAAAPMTAPLVFLDDDETVREAWLRELWSAHQRWPEALLSGAVFIHGPNGQQAERRMTSAGSTVANSGSGNLLLPPPVLALGTRFDTAFNLSGGEDTAFTSGLVRAGFTIRQVPSAVCDEYWPAERWTLEAATERARRQARIYVQAGPDTLGFRLNRVASGCLDLSVGHIGLWRGRLRHDADGVRRSLVRISKAWGSIEGVVAGLTR